MGEDAAVIEMGDRVLILTTDPITGAVEDVGWLSVHINANDVASRGVKPSWYLCTILLPEGSDDSVLETIMDQIDSACKELQIALVGGHSETTMGLTRPIIAGFMVGEASRDGYVTTSGAKPGDHIIATKTVGIEATGILARDLGSVLMEKIDGATLERAKQFRRDISVVKDSATAMRVAVTHALHDPTEGGIITGLWEVAEASKVGLLVEEEKIQVAEETSKICEALGLDPLKIMSSGSLLIITAPSMSGKLVAALKRQKIRASVIGKVMNKVEGRILVRGDGSRTSIEAVEQDQLYLALEKFGP